VHLLAVKALQVHGLSRLADHEHQEIFLGLGGVGVVDHQAATEARPHGCARQQLRLLGILRVHLQHCTCPAHQAAIPVLWQRTLSHRAAQNE
jgi:hypothetical protein